MSKRAKQKQKHKLKVGPVVNGEVVHIAPPGGLSTVEMPQGLTLEKVLDTYLQTVKAMSVGLRARDADDEQMRRILTQTIEEFYRAREDEGLVAAPLTVAAGYAAEQLVANVEGLSDEDRYSLRHYIVGRCGEIIHEVEEHPEIFRGWDDGRRERTLVAANAATQADDDSDHR